ncbi:MAG TPA: GntR family transcriptional regulator [Rectinemataceae bacterium]
MKKIITLSMRDQIYEALRENILKNVYTPASVLPIDRIAEDFGVSATPVREALVRLESEGLVSLIPNKGAIITDIQMEDILNNWEMRRLLEPYAAGKSAALIPSAEIDALKADTLAFQKAPFDDETYVSLDNRLHETLYIHLTNAFLKDAIRRVHQMSVRIRYFPEGSKLMHETVVKEVVGEHLAIIDALAGRDPVRITEFVQYHLRNGEKRAMDALMKRA